MKPTREQMESWWKEAKIAVLRTDRVVELAYAAGRKAGLLEARAILESVNSYSNPMTATDCIDEINDAMENNE